MLCCKESQVGIPSGAFSLLSLLLALADVFAPRGAARGRRRVGQGSALLRPGSEERQPGTRSAERNKRQAERHEGGPSALHSDRRSPCTVLLLLCASAGAPYQLPSLFSEHAQGPVYKQEFESPKHTLSDNSLPHPSKVRTATTAAAKPATASELCGRHTCARTHSRLL